MPTGFVHKQHIGYDPAKGFECSDIPEQWKAMFRSAGIKKSDMQNPEKAAVIYSALQAELGDDWADKPPPEYEPPSSASSPPKAKKAVPSIPKRGAPEAPSAPDAPPAPPDAPDAPSAPPIFSGSVPTGAAKPTQQRGGLLADINKGDFKLKKVEGEEKGAGGAGPGRPKAASSALPPDKVGSIMGALTQAMGERFKAVQSEEGDGADDVDDWSD